MQNYVFLLKIVCKEKKNSKSQPKKIVGGIMNCSYYSKLKKKSGSTKWHCRCTAQKHCTRIRTFIYKKKKHKSMIEKKKKYILNKPKIL